MASVLNKHRTGIPKGAVYIGRGSKWGNPFKIWEHGDRAEVLKLYNDWLHRQIMQDKLDLEELRGKDLVCFCSPLPCHGDILLEASNDHQH